MKLYRIAFLFLMIAIVTGCSSLSEDTSGSPTPIGGPALAEEEVAVDLSGYWEGTLAISPTSSLTIGFVITGTEVMLQIPSQGLKDYPVTLTPTGREPPYHRDGSIASIIQRNP